MSPEQMVANEQEANIELQHKWNVLAKELGEAYLQLDLVLAHIAKIKKQLGELSDAQ